MTSLPRAKTKTLRTRPWGRAARTAWTLLGFLVFVTQAPAAAPAGPFAGRFKFRDYGEEDGLRSLSPETLLQDHSGLLWVGTSDGLYRFDGRAFARFGTEDGLPSAKVTALHETKNGRLYVGTRSGLARWDGAGFLALGEKAGLPESAIGAITSDASNTVFVGTAKGLYLSIEELFHDEARKDGQPERPVIALHVDGAGALTFAREGGLYRRENGNTTEFGSARSLPALARIDSILTDRAGRLWVRTLDHLYVLPKGGSAFEADDGGLPPATGWGRLALDEKGELLVPTSRGLARKENGVWKLLTRRDGLASDIVLSALVDREGSLWTGFLGAGLARRVGRGRFTIFGRSEGLPSDIVWAIAREKGRGAARALWVGTHEGLARVSEDGTAKGVKTGEAVFALAAAEDGAVYAGSFAGVTRYPPNGAPRKLTAEGLGPEGFQVTALHALADGEVWAGARSGVYHLASGADRFTKVSLPQGEEPDSVFAFAEDGHGILYAAGRNGIQRLTGGSPRRFEKRNGLKADVVGTITSAADGSLIIAYRDVPGLDRVTIDGDQVLISTFSAPNRAVFLGRDAAGSIWAGASGVDVFPVEGGAPTHEGAFDGLPSQEVNSNAFFADADGTVWFGTTRGLVRSHPGVPGAAHAPPSVAFVDAFTGKRRLRFDPDSKSPLHLPADERDVTLTWTGASFVDASRLLYGVKLEPLQSEFGETPIPALQLSSLPAGAYTLHVRAVLPDVSSPGKASSIAFSIAPHWWESGWGWLLLAVVLGGAVFGVVHLRTRVLEGERRRLVETVESQKDEIEAQARELEEARLTDPVLGIRNRHFFFATIEGDIERAMRAHAPSAAPGERRSGDVLFYMVRVDSLKEINAQYGNEVGDQFLAEVVRRLKTIVRSSDYLIRWGGDDFLVVTRSSMREQGSILAGRLLNVLRKEPYSLPGGAVVSKTASIGWAPFPWYTAASWEVLYEDVLRLGEKALEFARQKGDVAVGVVPVAAQKSPADETHSPFHIGLEEAEGKTLKLVETEGGSPV